MPMILWYRKMITVSFSWSYKTYFALPDHHSNILIWNLHPVNCAPPYSTPQIYLELSQHQDSHQVISITMLCGAKPTPELALSAVLGWFGPAIWPLDPPLTHSFCGINRIALKSTFLWHFLVIIRYLSDKRMGTGGSILVFLSNYYRTSSLLAFICNFCWSVPDHNCIIILHLC